MRIDRIFLRVERRTARRFLVSDRRDRLADRRVEPTGQTRKTHEQFDVLLRRFSRRVDEQIENRFVLLQILNAKIFDVETTKRKLTGIG